VSCVGRSIAVIRNDFGVVDYPEFEDAILKARCLETLQDGYNIKRSLAARCLRTGHRSPIRSLVQ
jgi:hypothetical protein